jgi:hypothetical protein
MLVVFPFQEFRGDEKTMQFYLQVVQYTGIICEKKNNDENSS